MTGLARLDHGLLEAARSGDRAAIERVLDASQPDLMRFARRTCVTAEDAEDAVQVALWQIHRRLGTLRAIAAFASWLFRVVERECRRLFRVHRGSMPLEDALAVPADAVPLDLRRDLSAMIGALPDIYRTVLILRDVEELSAPETAAQLGISVDAVKSRLHRARELLRERLLTSGYWSGSGLPG